MDKNFKPTHMMENVPVMVIDEGWEGLEVPKLDGVDLPIGIYSQEEWTKGQWPVFRMTRDGKISAYCETWVGWKLQPIKTDT